MADNESHDNKGREYEVSVVESVEYRVTVTAADEDAAKRQAIAAVIEEGNKHFFAVHDRTATAEKASSDG